MIYEQLTCNDKNINKSLVESTRLILNKFGKKYNNKTIMTMYHNNIFKVTHETDSVILSSTVGILDIEFKIANGIMHHIEKGKAVDDNSTVNCYTFIRILTTALAEK